MLTLLRTYNFLKSFIRNKLDPRGDRLFTLGYERLDVANFLEILKNSNIQTLVDVREIPISRKQGFSRDELKEICSNHSLQYIHFRELGSPTWLRRKLKIDGNYDFFFKRYKSYLKNNGGRDFIEEVSRLAMSKRTCLLCFEKDYKICHRKIVASEAKKANGDGLEIVHLF